jgi:hypothetical protein
VSSTQLPDLATTGRAKRASTMLWCLHRARGRRVHGGRHACVARFDRLRVFWSGQSAETIAQAVAGSDSGEAVRRATHYLGHRDARLPKLAASCLKPSSIRELGIAPYPMTMPGCVATPAENADNATILTPRRGEASVVPINGHLTVVSSLDQSLPGPSEPADDLTTRLSVFSAN